MATKLGQLGRLYAPAAETERIPAVSSSRREPGADRATPESGTLMASPQPSSSSPRQGRRQRARFECVASGPVPSRA